MLTFCSFTFFQTYCFSDTVIKCVVVFAAMFVSFMVLSLPPVVHLEQSKCCRACLICRTTSTFQVSFGFILVIQYNLNIYLCRFCRYTVLYRTRTTNLVRNAGCGRSRYTMNFFKINQ